MSMVVGVEVAQKGRMRSGPCRICLFRINGENNLALFFTGAKDCDFCRITVWRVQLKTGVIGHMLHLPGSLIGSDLGWRGGRKTTQISSISWRYIDWSFALVVKENWKKAQTHISIIGAEVRIFEHKLCHRKDLSPISGKFNLWTTSTYIINYHYSKRLLQKPKPYFSPRTSKNAIQDFCSEVFLEPSLM